jgi:hypothetical protein
MTCDNPDCTACAAIRHFIAAREAGMPLEVVINDTLEVIGAVYDVEIIAGTLAEIEADRGTLH